MSARGGSPTSPGPDKLGATGPAGHQRSVPAAGNYREPEMRRSAQAPRGPRAARAEGCAPALPAGMHHGTYSSLTASAAPAKGRVPGVAAALHAGSCRRRVACWELSRRNTPLRARATPRPAAPGISGDPPTPSGKSRLPQNCPNCLLPLLGPLRDGKGRTGRWLLLRPHWLGAA